MAYKLSLYKKSYLLAGITKDDKNKEKVKESGASWNKSLNAWLFFPSKHQVGLKIAKEIGATIDDSILNSLQEKKESLITEKELIKLDELKELFIKFANSVCNTIDSFEGLDENIVKEKWTEFLPEIKNKVSNKKKLKKEIK